jgi:hypothetical protein
MAQTMTTPRDTADAPLRTRARPDAWARFWRAWYRLIRVFEPAMNRIALRAGLGNIVLVRVRGRKSGLERSIPLGLLRVGETWYLGHPSAECAWTRNLEAAGEATVEGHGLPRVAVRAVRLAAGAERDAAIRAAFRQHPFPGNALYRLSGRHVVALGTFFRLEPLEDEAPPATGGSDAAGRPD